jgi:hypothetical protein
MDHMRVQIFVLALAGVIFAQDSTLIEFNMEDQYKIKYSHNQFLGKVLIVVGSDREGSQFNEAWSRAILDSLTSFQLEDSITFMAVADLKGVPRLLRGFVRRKFPKNGYHPILLDWEGEFAKAYKHQNGCTNILLFNRDGRMIYKFYGREPEQPAILGVLNKIRQIFIK